MIYYRGRHHGIVTVNGKKVRAIHCDDVLGYAVVFKENANGSVMLNLSGSVQTEVIRGRVVFTPVPRPFRRNAPKRFRGN